MSKIGQDSYLALKPDGKRLRLDEEEEYGPSAAAIAEAQRLRIALENATSARERDKSRHDAQCDELQATVARLEGRVRFLAGEEEAAQSEAKETKARLAREREAHAAELGRAQAQVQELLLEQGQAAERARAAQQQLARLLDDQESGAGAAAAALGARLEEAHRELNSMRGQNATLEASIASLKEELAEAKRNTRAAALGLAGGGGGGEEEEGEAAAAAGGGGDLVDRCAALARQLAAARAEGAALARGAARATTLQEEVDALKGKLARLDAAAEANAAEAAAARTVAAERARWAAKFREVVAGLDAPPEVPAEGPTPEMALEAVRQYQVEKRARVEQLGRAEAQLAAASVTQTEARREAAAAAAQAQKEEERALAAEDRASRAEAALRRAEHEAAALADQLRILEEADLLSSKGGGEGEGGGPGGGGAAQQRGAERTTALEASLRAAREEIKELRARSAAMTPATVLAKNRERAARLEARLEAEEAKSAGLRRHLEKAERELARYEHEAAKGDYNPATTKVLHLKMNPAARARAQRAQDAAARELAALREENEQLKKELQQQKANTSSDGNTSIMHHSNELNSSRLEGSSGVDSSKLNQRLKEMFKEQIARFREAVYLLFGYKLDMGGAHARPKLRLRSMFAENESDDLLFQWGKGGLELCETDFATKIDRKVFVYLHQCNSVPAFLSNVTLNLFEAQTFQG